MNAFGDALRKVMDERGVTGVQLANEIGITQTSVSRILNGQSRPRQVTLSRIMKRLCESNTDQQALIRAYTGFDNSLPEENIIAEDPANLETERSRAKRYLEMKSQAIAFRRSVEAELKKTGIPYWTDYCEGPYAADFLIEYAESRLVLECKFNVHRDFEKTLSVAWLLKTHLNCKEVAIVIPYGKDSVMKDPAPFPIVELPILKDFVLELAPK